MSSYQTPLDDFREPIDEKAVGFTQTVLKWGLTLAGVSVGFTLLAYIFDSLFGIVTGVNMVAGFVIIYLALKEHRSELLSGYMSFNRGFIVALLILVISNAIGIIFNYIYITYINPGAVDMLLAKMEKMMSALITDEAILDEAMENAERDMRDPISVPKNIFMGTISAAVIATIYGAAMQKKMK